MDFGYFGLMGYRERGTPPRKVFEEHVEQVRQADAVGLDIAWFAEHHFSNYCICPSPLVMAAHCAAVTERIKLAPAVIVTPLYEPARVLAEIGMVDCLAGGRLVLGVGSGYQPYEFERFGVDIAKARAMLEEFLDMLHAAFTAETFSYEGEHYTMPPTTSARGRSPASRRSGWPATTRPVTGCARAGATFRCSPGAGAVRSTCARCVNASIAATSWKASHRAAPRSRSSGSCA